MSNTYNTVEYFLQDFRTEEINTNGLNGTAILLVRSSSSSCWEFMAAIPASIPLLVSMEKFLVNLCNLQDWQLCTILYDRDSIPLYTAFHE